LLNSFVTYRVKVAKFGRIMYGLRTRINPVKCVRIAQWIPLAEQSNYIGKIPNFQNLGAVNPHPEPIKVNFGREKRTCDQNID